MNRPVKHTIKSFTLVEIMIAMAVLVIMMGFLFQFINSAQRLWSASTRTASVFETAQIVFDVMETDLKNAVFSDEPGREIPFYVRTLTSTHVPSNPEMVGKYCGMFSNFASSGTDNNNVEKVGTYPVLFIFNATNKKIYRCAIDQDTYTLNDKDETKVTDIPNWYLFGSGFTKDFFLEFVKTFFGSNIDKVDELAAGVEDMEITPLFSDDETTNSFGFAKVRPEAVKITLTLYDSAADKLEEAAKEMRVDETKRVFSKIVYMQ
jgi:type II secretory pathway pseudopilin PulG